MTMSLFIHQLVDGSLRCFQFGDIRIAYAHVFGETVSSFLLNKYLQWVERYLHPTWYLATWNLRM